MLRLASALLARKNYNEFDSLTKEVNHKLSLYSHAKDIDYLKAEYYLLLAQRNLPCIPKMIEQIEIASDLFDRNHSKLFTPNFPDKLPEWIKKGNLNNNLNSRLCQGFWFIHASYLMHKKEYAKLAGVLTLFQSYYLPQIFISVPCLLCSIGYLGIGDIKKSESLLIEASNRLISDDFLFLVSVYSWGLKDMPERLIRDKYPDHIEKYLEIKNKFLKGYTTLRQEYGETLPSDLTSREKEVAILASKGLRNTEISEKLMITENTVKYHLRSIFQKLDISRRNRLAEKLNEL